MLENLALAKLRGYFLKYFRLDALDMDDLLSNSSYNIAILKKRIEMIKPIIGNIDFIE